MTVMSAFFKLKLDDEMWGIEITRDGDLAVLGYDWEQDDMLTFMTGQWSGVRKFRDEWQEDPIKIICFYFLSMEKPELLAIAADWAEHILRDVQERYSWFLGWQESVNSQLNDALGLARDLANGNLREQGRYEVKQQVNMVESRMHAIKGEIDSIAESFDEADRHQIKNARGAYVNTVDSVAQVLSAASWACEKITYDFMIILSAQHAASNAAEARKHFNYDPARDPEKAAGDMATEQGWQVRHFVHAMECVQANKKWPSIKETP